MATIYHVTTNEEWEEARRKGYYEAPSLVSEGFIHCSKAHQVQGIIERYFKGRNDLVKLEIDTDKLTSRMVEEWSPSVNDHFPHIFGRINLEAILQVFMV